MKILAVSDTHINRFQVQDEWIGQLDAVIHAGDLTNTGSYEEFVRAIGLLAEQLKDLKCPLCLITPGNHDNILERESERGKCLNYLDKVNKEQSLNINLIIDELVELKGYRVFMSPYYRGIGSGDIFGFHYTRKMANKLFYQIVPENIDVLVTHGPPLEVLDYVDADPYNEKEHYGCDILKEFLDYRESDDINIHIFGHIHEKGGRCESSDKRVSYNVATRPMLINLPDRA